MADNQAVAEGQSSNSNSRNRVANSVQAKAQEVLQEDYDKARGLVADAARSKSYLYPIKGIVYFATHRALWKPLLSKIGSYLILSASVVTGMFIFTYVPQLAILVFVNGPLAVFTTVLLILNESSAIINFVSRSYLLQESLLDTFDGTLLLRDEDGIVKEGRQIGPGSDPIQKLGKILKNPFEKYSPKALIRYLVYLPLNFIPIVGTGIFILLQARSRGQGVHGRYFQLKNWSSSRRADWLKKHTGPYTAFGLVATVLEMIPFASIIFTFTNTVGAALWAADIEAKNTAMTDGTAPALRETARKAE
ncbi:Outer spore wall protein RRT8 [Colletotrichum orbiculare MAFF 240422]|uniref:Outer spore wall protein RRT8 n=3 Tax=Colletotrichum orbiculare species complex TaxID=2707354 RepID=N4V9G8_COLOR|nr:Outer spore wall protein RRT8 [Colletotrichum orbiculare MAFF 240422]TDZ27681.1 Outer spore wall protein RRT8 [Colletotrichum spinosum]TDZ46840.1 Outer spore wall protein RRT8 [Colletotrichum trifolii]